MEGLGLTSVGLLKLAATTTVEGDFKGQVHGAELVSVLAMVPPVSPVPATETNCPALAPNDETVHADTVSDVLH